MEDIQASSDMLQDHAMISVQRLEQSQLISAFLTQVSCLPQAYVQDTCSKYYIDRSISVDFVVGEGAH